LNNLIKSPNSFVEIFGITEDELQDKWIEYIVMRQANLQQQRQEKLQQEIL